MNKPQIPAQPPADPSTTYRLVDAPILDEHELAAMAVAETIPGATCGEVRPGTLGYQRCYRITNHRGPHLPPDRGAWVKVAPTTAGSTS